MEFQQYLTQEGECWDSIAYKAYGNSNLIEIIISANPDVAIIDQLVAGTVLQIPVIPEEESESEIDALPPWKRL